MSCKAKRIISIVLAVVLAIGAFSVVSFATEEEAAPAVEETAAPAETSSVVEVKSGFGVSDELSATIIIPGIGQSKSTYCDENDKPILDKNGNEIGGELLIIDTSDLVGKLVKKLALPLISTLISQKVSNKLASGVYDTVSDLFSIQASTKEGEPVNNLVLTRYNCPLSQFDEDFKGWFYRMIPMQPVVSQMSDKYGVDGEDYIYLFTFPLIGDPIQSARELDDYIEMVKEQTGCKKVNLVGISLGGTIIASYMDITMENGGDFSDIDKIIGVVPCFNGTDLFGDFFDRNWNLADDYLYGTYVPAIMEANGMDEYIGHIINIALRILPKQAVYTILTAAMDAIMDTLVVNDPQFWAMFPSDRYEGIVDRYLSGEDYAVLRAKTDRFQQARVNLNDNLLYANANYGTEVFSVCGYGRQYDTGDYNFFGICGSSATSNSDSIVDIDSTSLGATYAIPGEKLEAKEGSRLSPDGELDISTCAFPDTTWFFYGQHHEVGRDDVILKLLANILSNDVKDVNSSPNFPQFNFNRNTRNLTRQGWLYDRATEVVENKEGKYTEEEVAAVRPAYDKATAMLNNTVMNENSADEAVQVTNELRAAMASIGLESMPAQTSVMVKLLNKITRGLDNLVMKTVGGKGYSDSIAK